MSTASVQGNPAYSREELEQWVQTGEADLGEIARIGKEGNYTLASFYRFDPAHPRPTIEAKVVEAPEDAPNHEGELCRGIVFLRNQPEHVIVYRPSE
jgi:hypothetical protein